MNFPNQIDSKRIILERPYPPTLELAKEIYKEVDASRAYLGKWLPWATNKYSLENELSYLKDWCETNWKNENGLHISSEKKKQKNF